MSIFQKAIDELFSRIETQLSAKLTAENFNIYKQVSSPEAFGSRYTEWRNDLAKLARRLVWDGKEGWFLLEESPFTATQLPKSWTDIVIVQIDKAKMTDPTYRASVVENIVNAQRHKA